MSSVGEGLTRVTCADSKIYIFDCGEGVQRQFHRTPFRQRTIDSIFITHMHGDHVSSQLRESHLIAVIFCLGSLYHMCTLQLVLLLLFVTGWCNTDVSFSYL